MLAEKILQRKITIFKKGSQFVTNKVIFLLL